MTIDQFLEHCREHTPDLEDIVSKYHKYEYIMTSMMSSPQKQCTHYNPNEEHSFIFEVDDPLIRDDQRVIFVATRKGVHVRDINYDEDSNADLYDDHYMTHEDCFKYLEQLPKTWYHFTSELD